MTPEPLVTVAWFATPDHAAEDLRRLQEAGLDAYLGGTYYRHHGAVELTVPESQVRKAVEILGIELATPERDAAPPARLTCPGCGSSDTEEVPPYSWRIMVAAVIVTAVSFALQRWWIGLVAIFLGWVGAVRLGPRAGNHRCRMCRREWKPGAA